MADAVINIAIKTDPAQPLQQLIKQSNQAEKAVEGLSSSFGKVAGAIGGLAALSGTFNFVLDATRQMEDLTTQFIAFTGSADGAAEQLERLSQFASASPFELAEVATANRTLLAFGSSTKDSIEQLRQLGEVSAATGTDLSELATIFGQIQAEGKLTGERFNQLVERGVNIGPELAKSLGVAGTAIRGLISDSAISSEEVAKAFQKMTKEGGQFFGSTERLSKTVSGSLSTLKDNITILASTVGSSAVPAFSSLVNIISKAVEGNIAYLKEQQKIANENAAQKRIREIGEELKGLNQTIADLQQRQKGGILGESSERSQRIADSISEVTKSIRELSLERLKLVKQEGIADSAKKDAEAASEAEKKITKDKEAEALKRKELLLIEQEEREKADKDFLQKVTDKEKAITEIAFQEASVRAQLIKEQEAANSETDNAEKIVALQEREAQLTSARLQIEADRLTLLKEFDNAELLRQQDTLNKKVSAEQKAENERLKNIEKNKAKEFDFNKVAAEQQKKFDEASALEKLKLTAGVLQDISALTRNKNRELAAIGKAAALFQIGIGIPDAAQRAYTSASIFGPVAGAAAAALAVAAGVQRLEEVRSQQLGFAQGGVVPGVGNKDTVPALLTPGEVVVPKKNFEDLESSFVQGAIANDQVILLRQSNDIQARILESVTFGAVIEKLTTIIAKLDQISLQSSSVPTFDTRTIEPVITEIAQNQPQSSEVQVSVLQANNRNRQRFANR